VKIGIFVATWNIERGLEFDAIKAALTNDQRFFRRLTPAMRSTRFDLKNVIDQAQRLSNADVVVLNEVDWGLKRTNYRNVARDLALASHMNYAYAVEFVEVDPLTLGTETLEGESGSDKAEIVKNLNVDTSRTLGLHGTAILSRFPLKNVRVVRFVNQGHDWYADEKKAVSALEKGKQKGAGIVFSERIVREVRRGGRMMILAEVEKPQIPGGVLTIVATHLEQKTKPSGRLKPVKSVKFVSENPEENFFTTLKEFRFKDGGAFDFRGAKQYSIGASEETLSDSNERASKGFVSTLELQGKITIQLKLDWIFVKPPNLTKPDDRQQTYLFAPQFGRTLKALNHSLKDRISDHSPLIADLPFSENQ